MRVDRTTMAWWFSVALIAAMLWNLGEVRAQKLPTPTIMIVDTVRIMRDARAMAAVRDQIENVRASFQQEIKNEEDALRQIDSQLQQQRQLLTPEAMQQKRDDLQKRASVLQATARDRRMQLDEAMRDAVRIVRDKLVEIVADMGKRHGANVVMQKSDLVWADSKMEYTDELLKRLNAELPSVAVSVPKK